MGMFLNSIVPYEAYKETDGARFFVDKSSLIEEIISSVMLDGQRHFCFTRPRRFGKSVMANMVGAFFGRTVDEREVFDNLEIAGWDRYRDNLQSVFERNKIRFIFVMDEWDAIFHKSFI